MTQNNVRGRGKLYRGIVEVVVGFIFLVMLTVSTYSDDWLLAYGIVPYLLLAFLGLFAVSAFLTVRGLVRIAFWVIRERRSTPVQR